MCASCSASWSLAAAKKSYPVQKKKETCRLPRQIVDSQRLKLRALRKDGYLFHLDHMLLVYTDPTTTPDDAMRLPPLPHPAHPDAPHLVVDAAARGSVARFVNHSCAPNLTVQPVLTQGCSGLRYRVALVAAQEVAAGEELSYDYGARYFFREGGGRVACGCGAPQCRGFLT